MRQTLSARLILWVGLPAAALFAAVVILATLHGFRRAAEVAQMRTGDLAQLHSARMDAALQRAQKIAHMMAAEIETGRFGRAEALEGWLRWCVEVNPEIYGSCIAFRPRGFDREVQAYAPYMYRSAAGLQFEQLGKPEYHYFQWAWYREPRDAGQALWSDPYFDEGGGNALMITYSVPFRRDGVFWGIVTIDIAITQLAEQITQLSLGKKGYAFIMDRHGTVVAAPARHGKAGMRLAEADPLRKAVLALAEDDEAPGGGFRGREPMAGVDALAGFAPIARGRLLAVFVSPVSEALAEAKTVAVQQLTLGGAGLLALFGAIVLVARSVTRPIRDLSRAAQAVAAGNLDVRIEQNGSAAEVSQLTAAFNKMTRDLQMRMQELRYTTTVKERLEGELSAARGIQMSLLPKKFPAFPDRTEFDVHAIVRPAREVGGDFYDFFMVDERRLAVLISDVAGKGVPAALFMAVGKALIKATLIHGGPLAQLMAKVNEELHEEADAGMFVTLLVVLLDTASGEIEYCNAGHLSPFLLRTGGDVAPLDGGHGPALALAGGLKFPVAKSRLAAGDALFLFTDGVTEALSKSREFYTPQRLQIVLRDVAALPVERITRSVVQDVRTFSAEQEQADDITVLAVRWIGAVALADDDAATVAASPTIFRSFASNPNPRHGR